MQSLARRVVLRAQLRWIGLAAPRGVEPPPMTVKKSLFVMTLVALFICMAASAGLAQSPASNKAFYTSTRDGILHRQSPPPASWEGKFSKAQAMTDQERVHRVNRDNWAWFVL